jgi:hypothetical protein
MVMMKKSESMYWIYRTQIVEIKGEIVQAQLVDPAPRDLLHTYKAFGFQDPMQNQPYGIDLELVFQVDPDHPKYDNYYQGAGFQLYSKRLITLMESCFVNAEIFPAKVVDKNHKELKEFDYYVFHSLEGIQPAMDELCSGWTGDHDIGIPILVLDYSKFEQRPIFICNHVYVPLMRDNLKILIEDAGITGFDFQPIDRFKSGSFSTLLDLDNE